MKKIALSLAVVAGSAAYVWDRPIAAVPDPLLALPTDVAVPEKVSAPPAEDTSPKPSPVEPPAALRMERLAAEPASALPPEHEDDGWPISVAPGVEEEEADEDSPALPTEPARLVDRIPLPRLRPAYPAIRAVAAPKVAPPVVKVAAAPPAPGFADGTYTGPVEDAYYGLVQVQALVANGQLVNVKVLRYPSDRRTSVYINRRALPVLREEVISADSADVDIVSGATLTSRAFIRSLSGALRQAGA